MDPFPTEKYLLYQQYQYVHQLLKSLARSLLYQLNFQDLIKFKIGPLQSQETQICIDIINRFTKKVYIFIVYVHYL